MPNWKKVIISGSDAILRSVTADEQGLFLNGQNAAYGVGPSNLNATSGFRIANGKAYTYVTPQPVNTKPIYFLGIQGAPGEVGAYPNNYIALNKALYFDPNESGGGGGHGDGTDGGPIRPGGTVSVNDKLNVFQYRRDDYTGSKDPRTGVSITGNPGIYFFNSDSSGSISGSLVYASASAEIKFDTGSSAIKFFAGSTNETLKEVLHISKSGDNPRIGVGTTNPKSTFDFKQVENTSTGTELLLRSARNSATGALNNDEGGSINFAIDSGSYTNLKTSGSLAKIKAIVNSVGLGGAQGKLVFELSKGASAEGNDVFSYGFSQINEPNFNLYSQIQSASLLIKDFSPTGYSTFEMRDNSDDIKLKIFRGDITASGNISASGELTGIINGGTF